MSAARGNVVPFRNPNAFPAHARDSLKERGINLKLAEKAGLRYVDPEEAQELVGLPIEKGSMGESLRSDGIAIPRADGSHDVRFLREGLPSAARYKSPSKSTPRLYLYRGQKWATAKKDATAKIIFTEGQFKAIVACEAGFLTISAPGAHGWLHDGGKPVEDFNEFDWDGRHVTLCFDSDVVQKYTVQEGLRRLADHLTNLGAVVFVKILPQQPDGSKNGIDDYIVRYGAKAFGALPEIPITDQQFDEWGAHPATRELNKALCMVTVSGASTILVESDNSDIPGAKHYDLVRPSDVAARYLNQRHKVGMKGKKVLVPIMRTAYEQWIQDKGRRSAHRVTFAPDQVSGFDRNSGTFNMYQGLGAQPIKPDLKRNSWSRLKQHIHEVTANGTDAHAEYQLNWMAWGLQNLAKRPEVALVFLSGEGTGKGIVFRALCKLYGAHAIQLVQRSQLTGNFNAHLKDKLMVFADEAFFAGDHQAANVLKNMITEPTRIIEPKYCNAFSVPNHIRLAIASNETWAVPAGADARRYAAFNVSDKRVDDHAYFARIVKELENGGYEAMLYDLQHRDLTGFDPRHLPKTSALFDQKRLSFKPIELWWFERLLEGRLPGKVGGTNTVEWVCDAWYSWVPCKNIQEHVRDRIGSNDHEGRSLETSLGMRFRKMCPGVEVERKSEGEQLRGYKFPSLKECQAAFERYVKTPIDWDSGLAVEPSE